MNAKDFSVAQRQALLDLAVLAMYSDRHLATAEDDRLRRLLTTLVPGSDYDRDQAFDAAVARVRPHLGSAEKVRVFIVKHAEVFADAPLRKRAVEIIDDLLASDSKVTDEENRCAATLREVFGL
jgi:hypothetical protein